jgi:hypothetical protein
MGLRSSLLLGWFKKPVSICRAVELTTVPVLGSIFTSQATIDQSRPPAPNEFAAFNVKSEQLPTDHGADNIGGGLLGDFGDDIVDADENAKGHTLPRTTEEHCAFMASVLSEISEPDPMRQVLIP